MSDISKLIVKRGDPMFPRLSENVARLTRFGEPRTFAAGETIGRIGETGHGLPVVFRAK